jgi:2'-5' RNA ligase
MRLFVSVDLPPDLADDVASVQERFADTSGLDPTDPEHVHVTLKFLGEVSEARLGRVEDAVAAGVDRAAVEPFEARFGGLGVFPSLDYINVVWLGLRDGGDALVALHEGIEAETTAIGFSPEDHAFTPHVTLGRMRHAGGKERVQELVRETDPSAGSMRVDEVRLTESTLTDDGPEYETVARFTL